MPIPPLRAIAIANFYSVAVSMDADTTGILTLIFLVIKDLTSVSAGIISEYEGTKSTSSNVSASCWNNVLFFMTNKRFNYLPSKTNAL